MKSPLKKSIGEVVTDYGTKVMKIMKKRLQRSLFDFYGDVKADNLRTREAINAPTTPVDGDGGIIYTKSADGKLYYKSNEVSEVELSASDTVLTTEQVQDIVGGMLVGTETRIGVTYDDTNGRIDFVVDDMTADTNTQNTTTLSFVDSSDDILLRNTTGGAGSGTDDIKFVAGSNVTLTHTDADNITIASTDTNTTYSEATGSAEGLMSIAHHDKLDGIEAGATADQTQADINGLAITTVGTIDTGVWNGTAIASAYLDSDTAHLSGTQTFSGTKTFSNTISGSIDGNAATATSATSAGTAKNIVGNTDDDVTITSDGNVTVKLDADNDESAQKFKVTNNADATVFNVTELGAVFLSGDVITNSTTTNDLTLQTDGSLTFQIDRDNDETNQKFSFVNFNIEVANINESGDLQIDGDLTVSGNEIKDDDGTTCITFDSSGNTAIAGTLAVGDIDVTSTAGQSLTITAGIYDNPVKIVGGDSKVYTTYSDNSTAGTNSIGVGAIGDDSYFRNDEGSFKFYVANDATVAAELTQAGNLTITGDIELGHATDTTIARSAAGKVSIEGDDIQTQGEKIGQYFQVKIKDLNSYMFYMYNDDYWYSAGSGTLAILGLSTAPSAISSANSKYQSRTACYTAVADCTVKKLQLTFYWSSSAVNAADIDFAFSKFTPITDGTAASITMNSITATDHNGSYTENKPYQKTFTFSGGNASLSAGDALGFHMRTTGGSSAQRVFIYGTAILSVELD